MVEGDGVRGEHTPPFWPLWLLPFSLRWSSSVTRWWSTRSPTDPNTSAASSRLWWRRQRSPSWCTRSRWAGLNLAAWMTTAGGATTTCGLGRIPPFWLNTGCTSQHPKLLYRVTTSPTTHRLSTCWLMRRWVLTDVPDLDGSKVTARLLSVHQFFFHFWF